MHKNRTKVTYLGNMNSRFTGVKTALENLEPLFSQFTTIKTGSNKKNQALRFLDMVRVFFSHGLSSDWIVIDVYSTKAFFFAKTIGGLAKTFRKRYILVLRGGNLPDRYEKEPNDFKNLFANAAHIVAPSFYLQDYFQKMGFSVRLIPNIIEIDDYPFQLRTIISPRVLNIRGFNSPYNPLMTVKCIKILRDRGYNVMLMMLGNEEDTYYQDVVNYIRLHELESLVNIQRRLPRKEWVLLSSGYDIMVSNPTVDNTPVSLIEGLALGMCVISTKVGGVPYLVEDGKEVVLVNSNNEWELADAILKLLSSSDFAKQLSLNGRVKAELFDWKSVKPLWEDILMT